MPVHDWTSVGVNVFHDFQRAYFTHLSEGLNNGVLPSGLLVDGAAQNSLPSSRGSAGWP